MTISFTDCTRPTVPQPQRIVIDGRDMGKVEPQIYSDGALSWHACINLQETTGEASGLVQGHGPTPAAAVGDGILNARRFIARYQKHLAWLEEQCGTTKLDDDDLAKASRPMPR